MYKAGNLIVGAKKANIENFELYKTYGGTVKSIDSVTAPKNPCAAFVE